MSAADYLFLTCVPFVKAGDQVTALGASARLGTLAPARALMGLGYDARAYSVGGDLTLVEDAVHKAKRIVFGELFKVKGEGWAPPMAAYRRLLGQIEAPAQRVVFSIADDHFDNPEFSVFYREVLGDCLTVTAVSESLAQSIRQITTRPVVIAPEPIEGKRGKPMSIAARRVPAPLAWLARRAGLSLDYWRVRLLWFGYPQNLPPLLELVPALERYASKHPLLLTCVTQPVAEIESLMTPARNTEHSRFRVQFVPWSPAAMASSLDTSDLVLIPSEYRNPVKQAKSPNRLIAGLHGGRFVVAHPLPAYAPYADYAWLGEDLCAGLDWAVRHPREVVERIARGQAFIDQKHSPAAVARAWLDVFHPKN